MTDDPRLQLLAKALAPQGVIGVSVTNWNDRSTWTFWKDGSPELNCLTDPVVGPLVQGFDTTIPTVDLLDAWDLITLKIAFNHENRIRALEGKAAITVAQFKAAVRSLL